MTYPQNHNGYPPPQPGQYPPPPPAGYGYPPPQQPAAPQWAPPPPPGKRSRKGIFAGIAAVIVALVLGYVFFVHGGNPEAGDCLVDTDDHFTGYTIVECSDPKAAYKVVDVDRGYSRDLGSCDGYPEGTPINKSGGKRGKRWEMCVVPLSSLK